MLCKLVTMLKLHGHSLLLMMWLCLLPAQIVSIRVYHGNLQINQLWCKLGRVVLRTCTAELHSRTEDAACRSAAHALPDKQLDVSNSAVTSIVQQYYTGLTSNAELRTTACTACKPPLPEMRAMLQDVPAEILSRFYGCGNPLPLGIDGLRVLDLGCGTGRDCYVAARLVGAHGFVTGVDVAAEALAVAQKHVGQYNEQVLKYDKVNMQFIQGQIEKLEGIAENSQDLVISNCVICLSPDKPAVLREVYRVLAPGGELHFSDLYCDRRLPHELRSHPSLLVEGLATSLYTNDFVGLAQQVGFSKPRILESRPVYVQDPELADMLGEARFFSVTYRLFKLPGQLESAEEDYGQVAMYNGSILGHKHSYLLDEHHKFITHKPMLVSGNTACILQSTWLAKHFVITGTRDVHFGAFSPCLAQPMEVDTKACNSGW